MLSQADPLKTGWAEDFIAPNNPSNSTVVRDRLDATKTYLLEPVKNVEKAMAICASNMQLKVKNASLPEQRYINSLTFGAFVLTTLKQASPKPPPHIVTP